MGEGEFSAFFQNEKEEVCGKSRLSDGLKQRSEESLSGGAWD